MRRSEHRTGLWRLSLEQIEATVADHLGNGRVPGNQAAACLSRQVSMYLAKNVGGWSTTRIGRFYNGRHHTTVLHAIEKIERLRGGDPRMSLQFRLWLRLVSTDKTAFSQLLLVSGLLLFPLFLVCVRDAAPLRAQVLVPLRAVRRALKTMPLAGGAALYARVKAVELAAEREEQRLIVAPWSRSPEPSSGEGMADAVNLTLYFTARGLAPEIGAELIKALRTTS